MGFNSGFKGLIVFEFGEPHFNHYI